jgi:hypothetical protein
VRRNNPCPCHAAQQLGGARFWLVERAGNVTDRPFRMGRREETQHFDGFLERLDHGNHAFVNRTGLGQHGREMVICPFRVAFLGDVIGFRHFRALLPLFPSISFSHKGEKGESGRLDPQNERKNAGVSPKTCP